MILTPGLLLSTPEWRFVMKRSFTWGLLILVGILSATALAHEDRSGVTPPDPANVYGEKLGTVILPFSCSKASNDQAKRGLALLHHMTY